MQRRGSSTPRRSASPPTTTDLFAETGYFPQFNITNFNPNTGGGTVGGALSGRQVFDVYSFQPTVTSFRGGHRFHAGYDVRVYRAEEIPATHAAGLYEFDARQVATRQFSDSPAAAMGQELAAAPARPAVGRTSRAQRDAQQSADSITRCSSRTTGRSPAGSPLNLGLRWDMETAPTERHDRNTRGFDFVSASPIEAAARAAYAANPIPQVPVDAFRVKGGLLFVDENNRGFYEPDTSDVQPRIGVAVRARCEDGRARRICALFGPVLHRRGESGRLLAANAARSDPECRPDLQRRSGEPLPRRRARAPGRLAWAWRRPSARR